ncbi:MAG: nitroreductase family protein [Actinomycetota bacterium]
MSPSLFGLVETDRLLTTTRAVRKRLDLTRPVERDVILECVRLATQAPTGGNTQGWRWVIVDDPEKRAGLAELYRRSATPYLAAHRTRLGDAATAQMGAVLDSSDYLAEVLHEVPVHVVPCLLGTLPETVHNVEASGFYGSILPAVWSFMLALRSRGLGSAYTTLHLVFEQEARRLLGIPDTVTQVALIPVAYTIGSDFKPASRRPTEEITYWNAWKATNRPS